MIRSKPRCARDHFFKKTFPRLDFLKVVLVTKIANSEKMKVKKFRPPYDLSISSPSLLASPTDFYENCSFYPIFWNFFSFNKRGGSGKSCIWLLLCVLVGALWCYLNVITAVGHVPYDFLERFSRLELPTFLWPNNTEDRE